MATIKKASVKAIEYCQKLTDVKLGKSTTWEQLFEIIMDGFEISVETHCEKQGDNTVIGLYKVDDSSIINTWSYPNSEIFDEKEGDWDWALIYKTVVEYLVKNLKKLNKGQKPKAKKVVVTKVDVPALMKEVTDLKNKIKEATGTEKKKLVKEYNEKSLILQAEIEKNVAIEEEKKQANKASADELKKLRNKKAALMQRIKEWEAKGKDSSELKVQLKEVTNQLLTAKTGIK